MKDKRLKNVATVAEAGLVLVIFVLLYLTMSQSPTQFVIAVSFCATVLLFIYVTIRARRRINRIVRRMTDEISDLPSDLSEKSYQHIQDETTIFFEELKRVKHLLDKRGRMRQELLDIVDMVASNMEFDKLLRDLLPKLNEATRSNCSAFYTVNQTTHKLEIKHSVGFSKNIYAEFDLTIGEGMIGQAALKNDITLYRDIPEDTIYYIRSFLGKIKPRCMMVVPVSLQDQMSGTLVCASIYEYTREDRDMVELIRHYLGVAVNNGLNYEKTKRLTNELTFQNKLIQDQHEEMKKRLDEKTQLLNCLLQHIDGDCLLDTRGTILIWNQHAEHIFGINSHAAIGKNIERLLEEHHWPSINASLQSAIKNGTHTECIWRYGSSGEKYNYELTTTRLLNDQHQPVGILHTITEVENISE